MCGIVGVLRLAADVPLIDRARVVAAVSGLAHRGPDEEGFHFEDGVALGFRRLSIVDLAGGRQPVASEDGSVWVVHNGEIYNHRELRAELVGNGHRFVTGSDAEVLVHGFERWGIEGLLGRLRGMFAFVVWDGRRRAFYAARDRMGIKPLHYVEHGGQLCVASEVRPLLACCGVAPRLDVDGLLLYLRIGFVPAPWTLFGGVRKLPSAHYLAVENGRCAIRCYWRLAYTPLAVADERAVVAEFRERLSETVQAHLMSDVPVGALLSGGVDSATVAAHMRAGLPAGFTAVTVGFDGRPQDERGRASASAEMLGLRHVVREFGDEAMDSFPAIVESLEELSWSATFAAVYVLYQTCWQHGLKVVLTGEGADELLGGYYWHWQRPMCRGLWSACGPLLRAASSGRCPRAERGVESLRQWEERRCLGPRDVVRHYLRWLQVQRPKELAAVLSPEMRREARRRPAEELLAHWEGWVRDLEHPDPFQQMLWLQSRTRLPDWINAMVDRMSMTHSVESRPPLQDYRLWEYCAGLPRRLKVRGYHPWQTEKFLLREAGRGLVPEAVRTAPKLGLQVPVHQWVGRARLPDWAEEALGEPSLRGTGVFDTAAVKRIRRQAQAGRAKQQRRLMVVLALQVWLQTFCRSR